MTIVWITFWAAALLLLPGWVIWRLVGPRGISPALQLAPVFAISMAVVALVGWSGFVLGLGFSGVRSVSIAVTGLAATGAPIALWYRRPASKEMLLPRWTLVVVLTIALGAALSALYSGPWLSSTADTFYHLAAIRSVIQHGTALPQEIFFSAPVPAPDPTSGPWHLALAMVSNLSGQDPLSVWRVMNVAVAPLTVLAFFALAIAITRSAPAALVACALYVVLALSLDFRDAAYPNRFGSLLAWLALAFALRFVDTGSRRELLVAAPAAFAASAVHPALAPFLLVAMACGLAAALLVRSPSRARFVLAAAVIAAATLPLVVVDTLTLATSSPYAAKAIAYPSPVHVFHRPWAWAWPGFWFDNPGTVLGTIFAISLVRFWRAGEAGAGLVVASLLAIPAAAATPVFATTYRGQYLLARVAAVLDPLGWLAWGWGLALAFGLLRGRLKVPVAAVLVVSAVAMAPALYLGPLARFVFPATSLRSFAATHKTDLTVAWRDRLAAIDGLPHDAVLLAEPKMAYELAGLTGREVVAVPISHTPAQIQMRDGPRRRQDALDAVQGRLDPVGLAGVIEHYGVTNVMVDTNGTGSIAWAQLADAAILAPIAGGDSWRLYRYDSNRLDTYLELRVQAGANPAVAVGVGPQVAFAGRAVFGRVVGRPGASGTAWLSASDLSSPNVFSRQVELDGGGSSQTFGLAIPSDTPAGQYALTLAPSGAPPIVLGRFFVGGLYQAEDMGGVVAADSTAWTTLGGADFQGGLAAVATALGSSTRQPIPTVGAGSYCVAARVYDFGTGGPNVLEVTVGDATARLSWSSWTAGMRSVQAAVTLDRPGGLLGTRLMQRGQGAAIVDSLEVYPLAAEACHSD